MTEEVFVLPVDIPHSTSEARRVRGCMSLGSANLGISPIYGGSRHDLSGIVQAMNRISHWFRFVFCRTFIFPCLFL